jgi:hypothetical protein
VRIEREVNGFGFPASQFLIRVGPNSQLQKIEANWPAVEFPPGIESRPLDEVANELSQIVESASTEYHYWFHLVPVDGPDHRFYLPTLRVKEPNFFAGNGMEIAGRVHTIVLAE